MKDHLKIANTTFSCSICFDDVLRMEVYITECEHKFCRKCLESHIEMSINDNNISFQNKNFGIKCPQENCEKLLENYEITQLVPKSIYEKLDIILRDFAIETAKDMNWCSTNNCGNVIIKSKETPMIFCYKCKYCWCSQCDVPWHADVTCQEYQTWKKNLKVKKLKEKTEYHTLLFEEWVKKNAKVCVSCGHAIQKNGGCNHMTCSRCRSQFCWLCNGVWKKCICPQFS